MIDFEERLRTELRAASEGRPVTTGLAARIDARIHRRERRVRAERVTAAGASFALVVAAGSLAVFGPAESGGLTSLANATPRDGTSGWATIADAPISERFQHTAVDMDGEVLVFGGYRDDDGAEGAAIYAPASGRWRRAASPPGDMRSAVAVWTGSLVLALDNDGRLFSFDPENDEWSERTRSPFETSGNAVTSVVWTGTVLLAVQGFGDDEGPQLIAPASYDPVTDEWAVADFDPLRFDAFARAAWTGDELIVATNDLAANRSYPRVSAIAFSPELGWSELPTPPIEQPDARMLGYSVWTGTELVIGGGMTWSPQAVALMNELVRDNREPSPDEWAVVSAASPALDAAAWNPATRTWRELPDAPVPTRGLSRYGDIWTGHEVVVWEMNANDELNRNTGRAALLDPGTGVWRLSAPAPFGFHQDAPATWTGHEIVIFSGEPSSSDGSSSGCCVPAPVGVTFTP